MFRLTVVFIALALTLRGRCTAVSSLSDSLELREIQEINVQEDAPVFIGFHGTNSKTAEFWHNQGHLAKPPAPVDSFWDSVGSILNGLNTRSLEVLPGSSGADAELGSGLYVADSPDTVVFFAQNNAKANPGTTPKVCAIWAKSDAVWNTVPKVFFPQKDQVEDLVQDSSDPAKKAIYEKARENYINAVLPHAGPDQSSKTIRFSLLDRNTHARVQTSQLLIPNSITKLFSAPECFDYVYGAADTTPLPGGLPSYNQNTLVYNSPGLRTLWNIIPENIPVGQAAVAAANAHALGRLA